MEQVNKCEQDCISTLEKISRKQADVKRALLSNDLEGSERLIDESRHILSMVDQMVKRLDSMAVVLSAKPKEKIRNIKGTIVKDLDLYKAKQSEFEEEIRRQQVFSSTRTQTMVQMNDAISNSANGVSTSENHMMLEQVKATTERSAGYLTDTSQSLQNTEHVGLEVLDNLNNQREALLGVHKNVKRTNSNYTDAQAALRRMACRAVYNKLVLWAIIIVLVAIIILATYFKFIKK